MKGFVRLAAAIPRCRVSDVPANQRAHLALWQQAEGDEAALVVFPELGLSSYTVRDLFVDDHLLSACETALRELCLQTRTLRSLAIVGLPLRIGDGLYNVAAVLQAGQVLGLVPKTYLPTYREYEERRWFRSGAELAPGHVVECLGQTVACGTDLLFQSDQQREFIVGVEVCEDAWVPLPPSSFQVLAGATVIATPAASNFVLGKAEQRRLMVHSLADRGCAAYVYVTAGPGESTTDLAYDADAFISEAGTELTASQRFARHDQRIVADVDLQLLGHTRLCRGTFGDCAAMHRRAFRRVSFAGRAPARIASKRQIAPHPFIPHDAATLATRCQEVFAIQKNALASRMQAVGNQRLVLGISGGIDSTHAALVGAATLETLGRPPSDLICVSMPGLGTSDPTKAQAEELAEALGATFRAIPIGDATAMVLAQLGHPAAAAAATSEALIAALRRTPALADVALENAQARLRTLLLLTLANQEQGLVIGTGDLSEKALGWSTYGGDQLAHYDVNAGVPKTLIQFVVRWVATEQVSAWSAGQPERLRAVLFRILATPISPELLPAGAADHIAQLTEACIGPYELADFFLYHFVARGARPTRILDVAKLAFGSRYDGATLKRWLKVFLERFFAQQFKRSCTADGPKVLALSLSPRGTWRMPSDASAASWLAEVDTYPNE